jgi:integrase
MASGPPTWTSKLGANVTPSFRCRPRPKAVIFYATDLTKNQKKKLNTLQRRLAAISQLHQEAGFPSPTQTWPMKQFLAGLRRELGVAPERKRPLLAEDLREILLDLPDTRLGKRDRALLLLGFSGAFRRSELVALDECTIPLGTRTMPGVETAKQGKVISFGLTIFLCLLLAA